MGVLFVAEMPFGNYALCHTAAATRSQRMQSKDRRGSVSLALNRPGWLCWAVAEFPSISAAARARQLGNIHSDHERLVPRKRLRPRSPAGRSLIIDICPRLLVVIPHGEARGAFLDRPGRREAAGRHGLGPLIVQFPFKVSRRAIAF
jgi:hypothetical protein